MENVLLYFPIYYGILRMYQGNLPLHVFLWDGNWESRIRLSSFVYLLIDASKVFTRRDAGDSVGEGGQSYYCKIVCCLTGILSLEAASRITL